MPLGTYIVYPHAGSDCEYLHAVLDSTQIKQVQGGGEEGARVKHAETSATGRVTRFFVDDHDGYNGFDIQWVNCDEPSRYTTREVLEGAERYGGDQGVTSPAKDDERVLLFLRAVLCMVNVQVRQFVVEDDKTFKRRYYPVALATDVRDKMMRTRKIAWDTICGYNRVFPVKGSSGQVSQLLLAQPSREGTGVKRAKREVVRKQRMGQKVGHDASPLSTDAPSLPQASTLIVAVKHILEVWANDTALFPPGKSN